MTDVTVPTAPPLGRVPNVEIGMAGTWRTSSGMMTLTAEDLYACVAALDCPAVRRPTLKPGHTGTFGVGDPAIGYIANLAVTDDGKTLVGDYCGMPGWLTATDDNGDSILSATYADRSGEWCFDYGCALGHNHPCVLLAVSLLGVEFPAIGTIASLQDVANFYGVAADTTPPDVGNVVVIPTRQETSMPNPAPRQVAASVTTDDVRRAFYTSPQGSSWDIWIEEVQLDPLQIIYANDADGFNYRIPVVLGDGDGSEAVSFGDPVRVVNNWTDAPVNQAAASAADANVVRFASRAESRPGRDPRTPQTPAASADGSVTTQEGSSAVSFTDEQLTTMRQRLGVADDADEATILAALDEALAEQLEPTTATPEIPEGSVLVEETVLEELRVAATAGQEARNEQLRQRREQLVTTAINEGRIAPARREHWLQQLAADPGAEQVLTALEPGLVPVTTPAGITGGEPASEDDATYKSLFGEEKAG